MKHYVVSDFHLNMGRDQDALHPLEDFDSDDEFEEFLNAVQSRNGHLVINGDWVDFLQLEPFAPLGDHESAGGVPLYYTASTAMKKLENCLRRQSRHFTQLRGFLAKGGRLTVVQGNHDADWFFPGPPDNPFPLQRRLRKELGEPSEEQLRFVEDYVRIGSVHIEHGHQRCEHVNAFQNHPSIFHRHRADQLQGERRIELLWGSRLVVEFFNGLEERYPFADNLKPMMRALWLGIKNRWVTGRIAADFLRFMLGAGTPWRDVAEVLEPGAEDPEKLVKSLPDEELKMLFLERLARDADFQLEMEAELAKAPQEEKDAWGPHPERSEVGREVVAAEHDAPAMGFFRDKREIREAKALLDQDGVSAVVFGHTHEAIDGNEPKPLAGYFNTGTWTRSLDLKNDEVKRRLRDADFPLELLKDPTIFQYRLTYLEITETPAGETLELKQVN